MDLFNLKPAPGSVKTNKRLGRGTGSGRGGTSTRGHKGAKSRSGFKNKRHFEGGQMPLQMRLPKRGFKNVNRKEYTAVNVSVLQNLHDKHGVSEVSMETLIKYGVASTNELVKILANGDLKAKLTVKFTNISPSAKAKIEAAGGSVSAE
ncbi:MAG TPA: 50S ribosomal protein L15 [Saprospiraceae bacterium]|nr:50S ribosomal protein L15 [Saprospiraceae bacterium]HRG21071.1 50S ribosomal protein L15 [Saprospiraceae bacterium]